MACQIYNPMLVKGDFLPTQSFLEFQRQRILAIRADKKLTAPIPQDYHQVTGMDLIIRDNSKRLIAQLPAITVRTAEYAPPVVFLDSRNTWQHFLKPCGEKQLFRVIYRPQGGGNLQEFRMLGSICYPLSTELYGRVLLDVLMGQSPEFSGSRPVSCNESVRFPRNGISWAVIIE
ncbi:hypothetical protein D3C81_1277610 [compost metagenome]